MTTVSETNPIAQRERALIISLRQQVGADLAAWAADRNLPTAERAVRARAMIADGLAEHTRNSIAGGIDVLPQDAEARITEAVINVLFGLGGFQPLLDDPSIENIYANGCDVVFVDTIHEKGKRVAPIANSDEEMIDMIRLAGARTGNDERRFDRGCPELNLELSDGSRMHAVAWITRRPSVTIRRNRFARGMTLSHLVDLGVMSREIAGQLGACVRAKKNIVVAGSTNAGKTTNLRALAAEISPLERLITVEDTLELRLGADADLHPNVVEMVSRAGNVEGVGAITQAQCVRAGLRMSPDRVIVGEVRGDEVLPMLAAMSQGNDGSMTTVHANSTEGVFTRFATYAAQAPERLSMEAANLLIAGAVDVVIHVAKIGGKRVLTGIREVVGFDGAQITSHEVYRPGPTGSAVHAFGWRAETVRELIDAGADESLFARGWAA
ncbi:pilus assembly protein CpaF [Catenulispora sp. GAS73]|uniref:CpaF family protein n=1 Tax=Catenulispora sp. GAS73 TaxID=3156269 RepID=UPI00351246C6